MGRIRTNFIKKMTERLFEENPKKFGKDFEENKYALKEMQITDSKLIRNKIAGYMVKVSQRKRY